MKKTAETTFQAFRDAADMFHDGEFDSRRPAFNLSAVKHLIHPNATNEVKMGNIDRFQFAIILARAKAQVRVNIIHARNSSNNDKDCFTACFDTLSLDVTNFFTSAVNHIGGSQNNSSMFGAGQKSDHAKEFWTFQRLGNKWLLLCIHDEHNWEMFQNMRILDEGQLEKK